MTQETQAKTVIIAEYDGWVKEVSNEGSFYYQKNDYIPLPIEIAAKFFKYSTSDEWLMPVARKVHKEMTDLHLKSKECAHMHVVWGGKIQLHIQMLCIQFPETTSGLFNAVYKSIKFLNTIKQQQ